MPFIKPLDFDRRFVTRINKLTIPRHIFPAALYLPTNSAIHFIAESEQAIGIDSSYNLLRNASGQIYTFHVVTLVHKVGNVSSTHVAPTPLIRRYQKTHLNIRPITNLDRTLSNNPAPVVLNYSLLPRLNKYSNNALIVYQEWFNIRATMWDMVHQIGGRRSQFINYQLPEVLPTKANLIKYAAAFKVGAIGDFHDTNVLNILELWRIISLDVASPVSAIPAETIEHINLVFSESGVLIVVRLQELLEWAQQDNLKAATGFYRFLDKLMELRTPVETTAVVTEDSEKIILEDQPVNTAIAKLIKEQGAVGNLSAAEQRGLFKLAERYKTIEDPHGSGVTLDKLIVTDTDLHVNKAQLLANPHNILDKSMLESTIQNLDKDYIKNVLHKDITQAILMLHPAGVIVKDIKVRNKSTAVTKASTYSVYVQPINGAASVINFTIPIINSDGTFLSGGVKYRMDKQKGDNKPYTM